MNESKQAGEFFDRFSEIFDTFYEGKRSKWMQWVDRHFRSEIYLRYELTFEAFGDLKQKTVLDIGCGSGVYVMEALRRGALHVYAVDPAPGMLRLVRARLQKADLEQRCDLIQSVFPAPNLKSADHVIVMGVMDYVKDAEGFLRALRPLVLQSAAVAFPSKHWFRTPFRKYRYKVRRCPVYFYDEAQIRDICRKAGFGQTKVFKIPGAGQGYHVVMQP